MKNIILVGSDPKLVVCKGVTDIITLIALPISSYLGALTMTNLSERKPQLSSNGAKVLYSLQSYAGLESNNSNRREKARQKLDKLTWFILIVSVIVFTSLSMFFSYHFCVSPEPGIIISTIAWSVVLGGVALFFLPNKAINIIFGAISGAGVSDIQSGSGLISSTNKIIQNISHDICLIFVDNNCNTDNLFIKRMVWMSVVIIWLLCLPCIFGIVEQENK